MSSAPTLPPHDPTIDELDFDGRMRVARLWHARAQNERHTSGVFGALERALREQGAALPVLELAQRAIQDELAHGALCDEVSTRYAATPAGLSSEPAALVPEALAPPRAPHFHGCSERENGLLFVVLQCCLNESIAAAYLSVCLEQARGAVVRTALRALLRDEVTHSRIGWAHLASDAVTDSERRVVSEAMPELLSAIRRIWLADPEGLHAAAPPGHGSLRLDEIDGVLLDTVDTVIVPGLTHVGVDSSPSSAWAAAGRG